MSGRENTLVLNGWLGLQELPSAPPTSDNGVGKLYCKTGDSAVYFRKDNDGAEYNLTTGGGGGSGDVVGPASATDNAIARYDTTTGKLLQNSAVSIADAGHVEPATDNAQTCGSVSKRWSEVRAVAVITGDLEMKSPHDDGASGHWKLIEDLDRIVAINVLTGKKFSISMTPLEE